MEILNNNLISVLTSPLFYIILLITLGGVSGFVGFFFGVRAYIDVQALQKSTHTIQYAPVDLEIDKHNQEVMKKQWVTPDSVLDEQEKLFKADLEEEMPFLAPDEDDKKHYSF